VKLGRAGRVEAKYTYTPMTPRISQARQATGSKGVEFEQPVPEAAVVRVAHLDAVETGAT
jgi:hypothetical protein